MNIQLVLFYRQKPNKKSLNLLNNLTKQEEKQKNYLKKQKEKLRRQEKMRLTNSQPALKCLRDSPLRFGAIALGQHVDMLLRLWHSAQICYRKLQIFPERYTPCRA